MKESVDLADPTFEPTGEQLQALSQRAFANVAAANQRRLERLHAEIAEARQAALRRLEQMEKRKPR